MISEYGVDEEVDEEKERDERSNQEVSEDPPHPFEGRGSMLLRVTMWLMRLMDLASGASASLLYTDFFPRAQFGVG